MTIDIKKLKTDLAYWLEVAPEGATHCQPDPEADFFWYNHDERAALSKRSGRWCYSHSGEFYWATLIPRPSPAWDGSGLPPVGVECEVCTAQRWVAAKILYIDGRHCIAIGADQSGASTHYKTQKTQFRPIKTEKERVVEWAMDAANFGENMRRGIEALYDAGALKMPGGEV